MIPIFDPKGSTVGWMKDDLLFAADGAAAAFLKEENIINFAGLHCGFLISSFFRDHGGNIVAFLREAQGGPRLPVIKIPPPAPIPGFFPFKPVPPIAPLRPMLTLNWSDLSWENFLSARKLPPRPQAPQPPPPPAR